MTDNTNEIDQAERVRRLQERRAASGRTRPTATAMSAEAENVAPVAPARSTAPRRRHPAAATRWMLAGLSVASFFGIAGTVAAANVASVSAATPVATPVTANAVATTPAAATPSSTATTKAATATASTSAAHVSHTKTHGS